MGHVRWRFEGERGNLVSLEIWTWINATQMNLPVANGQQIFVDNVHGGMGFKFLHSFFNVHNCYSAGRPSLTLIAFSSRDTGRGGCRVFLMYDGGIVWFPAGWLLTSWTAASTTLSRCFQWMVEHQPMGRTYLEYLALHGVSHQS